MLTELYLNYNQYQFIQEEEGSSFWDLYLGQLEIYLCKDDII